MSDQVSRLSEVPAVHQKMWDEARRVVATFLRIYCLRQDPPEVLLLAVVASTKSAAAFFLERFFSTRVFVWDDDAIVSVLTGSRVLDFLKGYAKREVPWPEEGEIDAHVLIVDADEHCVTARLPLPPIRPGSKLVCGDWN